MPKILSGRIILQKVDNKKIIFMHFLHNGLLQSHLLGVWLSCQINSELSEFFSFFCAAYSKIGSLMRPMMFNNYTLKLHVYDLSFMIRISLVLVHEVVDASLMCSTSTKRPLISIVNSGKSLCRSYFYRLL